MTDETKPTGEDDSPDDTAPKRPGSRASPGPEHFACEKRPDPKRFSAWLATIERLEDERFKDEAAHWERRVDELVESSRRRERLDRDYAEAMKRGPQVEGHGWAWRLSPERAEELRRELCRRLVRHVVVGRAISRRLRNEVLACAEEGFLPAFERDESAVAKALRSLKLNLAQAVATRVPEVVEPWLTQYLNSTGRPKTNDWLSDGVLFGLVLYEAGCLMRATGRLQPCFHAFARTMDIWFDYGRHEVAWAPPDAVVPGAGRPSRYGLPCLLPPSACDEELYSQMFLDDLHANMVHVSLPWPADLPFDWSPWDYVIGCGTTIDDMALEQIGVPDEKRRVLEVHVLSRHFLDHRAVPLAGRIAVVDDAHEGETSATLAQVYNADAIHLPLVGGQVRLGTIMPVASYPGGWSAVREALGRWES